MSYFPATAANLAVAAGVPDSPLELLAMALNPFLYIGVRLELV